MEMRKLFSLTLQNFAVKVYFSLAARKATYVRWPPHRLQIPPSPTTPPQSIGHVRKEIAICWSNLPPYLLQFVFERHCFTDFKRAKSVCTSWESVSRKSQPKNKIPWVILFPKDSSYGLLFNPEEQGKLYKTQDLGDDFAKSFCVGAYRSWLLMLDPQYRDFVNLNTEDPLYNLYILDLLTRERITLPTLESEFGLTGPMFWINEKTKDYLVLGMFNEETTVPHLLGIEECFNMEYKDHKLYCLNYHKLKIFDFSGDIPVKVFKVSVRGMHTNIVELSWTNASNHPTNNSHIVATTPAKPEPRPIKLKHTTTPTLV